MRLLLIEDGNEYEEFARTFLGDRFEIHAVHSGAEACARLEAGRRDPSRAIDALLVDLRFERARSEDLVGDLADLGRRMFAGDLERARRWAKDQQGTLILGVLRKAGFRQRAVFVHDFPPDRLANLRKLYGDVHAVPSFDAEAIRRALSEDPRMVTS
ncbi:MAG: hypothetical protein J0L92_41900 [Deltaproteobacteria bacterium]|nr:hypothetical protein [Deltaproteobacteria bacterium]